MDGSQGGSHGGPSSHDGRSPGPIANPMEQLQQQANVLREIALPYKDQTHSLFDSLVGSRLDQTIFGGTVVGKLLGLSKEHIVPQCVGLGAALAGINGRMLGEPQANAVVDSVMYASTATAMQSLTLAAIVGGVMRARYRVKGIKIPKNVTNPWLRRLWPAVQFTAYYVPANFFINPLWSAVASANSAKRFQNDPRMEGWNLRIGEAVAMRLKDPNYKPQSRPETAGQYDNSSSGSGSDSGAWDSMMSSSGMRSDSSDYSQSQPQSQSQSQSPSWGSSSYQSSSQQPAQTLNDAWNTSNSDSDFDDASPVAASYRNTPAQSSGSSWDRIRQQSQAQDRQPRQQAAPPQRSTESYTYSRADYERSAPKDQAQRDFDRMLDQERKGIENENKRWR